MPAVKPTLSLALAISLALALVASVIGASDAAGAVSRDRAAAIAIKALGVETRKGPEIVFGTASKVPGGTKIREVGVSGAPRVSNRGDSVASTGTIRSTAPVVATVDGSSWVFYNDRSPRFGWGAGKTARVAIVNARTGGVVTTQSLEWPPSIGGSLPPYLQSVRAYESSGYRDFARGVGTNRSAGRQQVTGLFETAPDWSNALGGTSMCALRLGGTLIERSIYDVSGVAESDRELGVLFGRMNFRNNSFGQLRYRPDINVSPAKWIASATNTDCKDVLIWIAGGLYESGGAISIGQSEAGDEVRHQPLYASDLREVFQERSGSRFTVVVDAPSSDAFARLDDEPNVVVAAASSSIGRPGSRWASSSTLSTTSVLGSGIARVLSDGSALRGATMSKRCRLALALLVAKAFDRSACPDPNTSAPAPAPAPGPPAPTPPPELVLVRDLADLTVGLSVDKPRPEVGDTVRFVVSVINRGPSAAGGVQVRTTLPSGFTPLAASGNAAFTPTRVTWNLGDIPSGAVRVQTIDARVPAGAAGTAVAELMATDRSDPNSVPGNGNAGEDDQASVAVTPITADIGLSHDLPLGGYSPRVETTAIGLLRARNDGPDAAQDVVIALRFPPSWSQISLNPNSGSVAADPVEPNTYRWTVPSVAVGETRSLGWTADVGSVVGPSPVLMEVVSSGRADPDSSPGNGVSAGEDDGLSLPFSVAR